MEPIFFTKTCARDALRVSYQIAAIRRQFPLATHVVMIEQSEVHSIQAFANAFTLIFSVETLMPEAMQLEPYLRQQYCKLMTPIVLGVDTIQLDSDMCPKPGVSWIDELFAGQTLPRWYCERKPAALKGGLERLNDGYAALFGDFGNRQEAELSFMHSQLGWYVRRRAAASFVRGVGGIEKLASEMQRVVAGGQLFSEYQFLGRWSYSRGLYTFYEKRELHPWLYHFPSTEPLLPEQEKLLREAAGL